MYKDYVHSFFLARNLLGWELCVLTGLGVAVVLKVKLGINYFMWVVQNGLLYPQHFNGIWSGLTPYRLPFDTLGEYSEP